MFTASKSQIFTYLIIICLFSVSILVFLNSSISFLVTTLLHQKHGVGNVVGTLGFADELLAVFACPIWGLVSDYAGVKIVETPASIAIHVLTFLGMHSGVCHCWSCATSLSPCVQRLSTVATHQITIQYRSSRPYDYDHRNTTFDDGS